jgi:tetratricopeptide (TPR) repeat protein
MTAKALTPKALLDSLCRVLHTLNWVHKKYKTIHRDLKPENILFDEHDRAYISDWGLAKLCGEQMGKVVGDKQDFVAQNPALTQTGSFLGTVMYASPEQIQGQGKIDHRSDIYSLGCIMYEMETGHPPFDGRTVSEIAKRHLRSVPPRLGGLFRRTTLGLESVIERCLKKCPLDRYQDYDELLADVVRVCSRRGGYIPSDCPPLRAYRPVPGVDEFRKMFLSKMLKEGEKIGVVKLDDLKPYIEEFGALASLGKWNEAKDIIESLYFPELASPCQHWHSGHTVALNFALCLIKCGKADEAVKVLSPLAEMVDQPDTYYVNHSLALLHINSHAAAEALCATGLKRFPRDKDLLGNYIIALQAQGKLSEALVCLEEFLKHGRDVHFLETGAAILNRLATAAGEQDWGACVKYRKRALDLLLEAKQLNPRFVTARFNLASTLFDLEQFRSAADEYWEVARLCGKKNTITDRAIEGVARILLEMGAPNESIKFCEKWMSEVGDVTELTRSMSMALTERHVVQDGKRIIICEAFEFFENIVSTEKAHVEDFCYLADLYGRMDRFDEAKDTLKRAQERFPQNWRVPYYRGLVQHQAGQSEAAIRSLEEASRLAPFRSDPDWKLAQVYQSLGNGQEADRLQKQSEAKKAQRKAIVDAELTMV